jgi:hypothetical protein
MLMTRSCDPITDERRLVGLSSEQKLVCALFRQAIQDARSQRAAQTEKPTVRQDAQRWLRDREEVTYWLTLAGLPEGVYEQLLEAAGLEDA